MAMFGMTDSLKAQLIQEIYRRPLIWKVTDAKYTDVPARWCAFEEIANAMSSDDVTFSSDMIKVAWKNMMDYYNQIRRRHDRAAAAGTPAPASKWQFYEMMHFTRQDKPPVKRKYNWMEPSKIPREDFNGQFVNHNSNHAMGYYVHSPTSVMVKSEPGFSGLTHGHLSLPATSNSAPRTKKSERAKLQAKRAAATLNVGSAEKSHGQSAPTTPTKALKPRKEGLRKSPKKNKRFVDEEFIIEDYYTLDEEGVSPSKAARLSDVSNSVAESVKHRGRPRKKRFNLSPSPQKSPRKRMSPKDSSGSPQKQGTASPQKQVLSPIASNTGYAQQLNGTSFERHIVSRLMAIRSQSEASYSRACRALDEVLADHETLPISANLNKKGFK